MRPWVRRASVAVLCSLSLQGCYVYRDGDPGRYDPGERIRARLGPAEAGRLETFMAEESRTLEGTVVEAAGDSVLMAVTVHSALQGNRIRNLEQRVYVARDGILDVEVRRLDAGRTAFVAAAGVAALVSAFIVGTIDQGTPRDPGPTPTESRIPFWGFAIPWR